VIAGSVAVLILYALQAFAAHHYYPVKFHFDRELARRLIQVAWPAAVLEVVGMFYLRGSYFLLGSAGADALGQYAAADKLVRPFFSISSVIVASSLPTVATIAADHQYERLKRMYGKTILRATSALILVVTGAFIAVPWVLTRFAPAYVPAIGPFRILVFGGMFMFLNQISSTFIIGMGRFRTIMFIALGNMVVYFSLATYLVPRYSASGAATATSLMEGLNTIVQLIVVRYIIHESIHEHSHRAT
jgi:O-antigen/teichoic acid export membrane protein